MSQKKGFFLLLVWCPWLRREWNRESILGIYLPDHVCRIAWWIDGGQTHRFWWYFFGIRFCGTADGSRRLDKLIWCTSYSWVIGVNAMDQLYTNAKSGGREQSSGSGNITNRGWAISALAAYGEGEVSNCCFIVRIWRHHHFGWWVDIFYWSSWGDYSPS